MVCTAAAPARKEPSRQMTLLPTKKFWDPIKIRDRTSCRQAVAACRGEHWKENSVYRSCGLLHLPSKMKRLFLSYHQETAAPSRGEAAGDLGGGRRESAPFLLLRRLEDGRGEAVPSAAHPLLQQQVRRDRRLPVRSEVYVEDAQRIGGTRHSLGACTTLLSSIGSFSISADFVLVQYIHVTCM